MDDFPVCRLKKVRDEQKLAQSLFGLQARRKWTRPPRDGEEDRMLFFHATLAWRRGKRLA